MHTPVELYGSQRVFDRLGPGKVVIAERQSGKTTALLQYVAKVTQGRLKIGFVSINEQMSDYAQKSYEKMLSVGAEGNPTGILFVTPACLYRLRGWTNRIVVDEWFLLDRRKRSQLKDEYTILAAVGSLPSVCEVSLSDVSAIQ